MTKHQNAYDSWSELHTQFPLKSHFKTELPLHTHWKRHEWLLHFFNWESEERDINFDPSSSLIFYLMHYFFILLNDVQITKSSQENRSMYMDAGVEDPYSLSSYPHINRLTQLNEIKTKYKIIILKYKNIYSFY